MSLQSWLLFLHVLGAIVWLGAGATVSLIGLRVQRSRDRGVVADFARTLRYLGLRAFMPALFVVLATGFVLVLDGSHWRISEPWILIGLALFLIAFLIGAVYLSQVGIALERTVTTPDHDVGEATALIERWVIGYGAILLVLVVAVWDMVFKPFA
ncbi:MAG: DUF2269 family protein [Spirochaetia bacterium]|jgi:uncharacterized membrane protein